MQGLVNIAMVIGWFPVTGIPLPFISFGGTSLLMNMAALGLIWGTATQSLREYDEQERRKRIAAMEGRPLPSANCRVPFTVQGLETKSKRGCEKMVTHFFTAPL